MVEFPAMTAIIVTGATIVNTIIALDNFTHRRRGTVQSQLDTHLEIAKEKDAEYERRLKANEDRTRLLREDVMGKMKELHDNASDYADLQQRSVGLVETRVAVLDERMSSISATLNRVHDIIERRHRSDT